MSAQRPAATAEAGSPPEVYATGPVPRRIETALQETFSLVPEPRGAAGVLAMITTTVDGAFLDAVGPS